MHEDIERILLSEQEIQAGIDRVAEGITDRFRDERLTVVSVLKGSCVFASDLIRRLPIRLELAFVSASSYGDGTTSGELRLDFFPTDQEVAGRKLLLVDDILDTGRTMHSLVSAFEARGAAEVASCVFLDKPSRRAVQYEADFSCFHVENLFVVGYGLDYAGGYRNLPYVGALRPEIYSRTEAAASEAATP
jgi:hypoxanthine phosphoribosyltransferase